MIIPTKSKRVRRVSAVSALTAGTVLIGGAFLAPAQAAARPEVSAKGAYLVDATTGKAIYSKAAATKRPMASTTKIMTASVVLDTANLDLDRKVTVKEDYRDYVTKVGASTADLQTGDKLTIRQLLYATMLPSGSDAAMALADTFGSGSTVEARTKSFISMMNSKAGSLGLENTSFDSFDGNSEAGKTYTTPRDLATLTRHALKIPTFRKVVKSKKTVRKAKAANGRTRTYTWYNTNQLLGSYKGAIGVKTGTTTPAGPCLVFAAKRGSKTVVGVILNSSKRYPDAEKMLNYGFNAEDAAPMKLRPLPQGAQLD